MLYDGVMTASVKTGIEISTWKLDKYVRLSLCFNKVIWLREFPVHFVTFEI